jgi:hypothetical protein
LAPLIAGANFELDLIALAQVVELDLGRQTRAMEEDLVPAVVGNDESETLILNHSLYRAVHKCLVSSQQLPDGEVWDNLPDEIHLLQEAYPPRDLCKADLFSLFMAII